MTRPWTSHPVQLVVEDDLQQEQAHRLLPAPARDPAPHLAVPLDAAHGASSRSSTWVVTLVAGRPPASLHRFMCSYIRYQVHLSAYLALAGNPYPPFIGEEGEYPIDVAAARRRSRSPAGRRSCASSSRSRRCCSRRPSAARAASASAKGATRLPARTAAAARSAALRGPRLVREPRPRAACRRGCATPARTRSATRAQVLAYLLFVTDRYPNADPTAMLDGVERPPEHPVQLVGDAHDLRRSRVTVFFRILLALPHLIWLALWAIAAVLRRDRELVRDALRAARRPASLHGFLSRFVRYALHVYAFIYLAANPFPAFRRRDGHLPARPRASRTRPPEPLEDRLPHRARDPGASSSTARSRGACSSPAVLTWFVALVTGQRAVGAAEPDGVRASLRGAGERLLLLLDGRVSAREPARGSARPQADDYAGVTAKTAGARARCAAVPRGGLGGRRVSPLAVVGAVVPPAAARRRCGSCSRRRSCTRLRRSAAFTTLDWVLAEVDPARRLRPLRVARRAVHARVGGGADRHGDAARDDRLRARLALAAPVRRPEPLVGAPPSPDARRLPHVRASATGSRSASEFVFLCLALLIVMGLARFARRVVVAARGPGLRRARHAVGVRHAVSAQHAPSARRAAAGAGAHARADRARAAHADRRRARPRRDVAAERRGDGSRPEPARRPLGHAARRTVHRPRAARRRRARARTSRAQHIWKDVGWYALFAFPGAFLIARVTRRRGGMGEAGGGAARAARRSSCSTCSRCRCRTRSRGTWRPRRTGGRCRRRTTPPRRRRCSALRLDDARRAEPVDVGVPHAREPPDDRAADRDGRGVAAPQYSGR